MADEPTSRVSIHEGVVDKLPPKDPGADEAERTLWQWLDNLATESDRVRREEARFDQFNGWLDLYYGRHWPTTMPSFRPPVVINELRTLILSEASDLSDSNLRLYVMKDPRTGGRDEEVERAIRAVWQRQEIDLKLMNAMCWALIVGTGFLRCQWDPNAFYGFGDVHVEDVDPRYILPDPDAVNDKDWAYVMVESVMDIAEIRRLFPVSGQRVKPEEGWSVRDNRSVRGDTISWPSYEGPMTGDSTLIGSSFPGYKKGRARVLDLMVRDPREVTAYQEVKDAHGDPVLDENGTPTYRTTTQMRYPNGRRIVGANGVILMDGDNPNPNGDFGILRVILEPALGRFWSQGFAQQTGEIQTAANKLQSTIVENAIRLNNGTVIATTNTGLDLESYSGMPGQIVQINPGSAFDIKYPPPMPPDMIRAPVDLLNLQRRVLGFPEGRTGKAGAGNTSAELTETEISQAQGPTRLRARMMYYTVQRLAEMILARMAYGYVTPRVIPAVEGEAFKPVTWTPMPDPAQYSIYVDPASFQIMSRTMLKRMGLALYRLGAIDRKSVLEALGWPDWEETAGRMDKAEKLAAIAKIEGGKS